MTKARLEGLSDVPVKRSMIPRFIVMPADPVGPAVLSLKGKCRGETMAVFMEADDRLRYRLMLMASYAWRFLKKWWNGDSNA